MGGLTPGIRQMKYREQPIISIGSREFLSGVAPGGAHGGGALLYKADGITPVAEPGASQSANNGLLMCGAQPTAVSGTLTGSIIGLCSDGGISYVSGGVFCVTDGGVLYKFRADNTFGSGLVSIRTGLTNSTSGLLVFQGSSGLPYLLYRQAGQMGRYDGTTFTDNWQTLTVDYFGAMYQYGNTVLFGNGLGKIGKINADFTVNTSALAIPSDSYCTTIADDGVWAMIAISRNQQADTSILGVNTRIQFWDGYSTLPVREYVLPDPSIFALKKMSLGVFAFGSTGIWQVSFKGIKKIFSNPTGVYTRTGLGIHYGGAVSYFSSALMWGGTSGANNVLKTYGQIDTNFKSAYYTSHLLTAGQNITVVDAQLLKGWVYVGDSTPQLLAYPIGTNNAPQVGNTAQTTYFQVKERFQVNRIDVIFAVPLASGDSFSVSLLKDENTAAISMGTATFASDGATRRKSMISSTPVQIDDQFSLKLTFTAGAVKVKRVDVYGHFMSV